MAAFQHLAERGLELLEGKDPQLRQRLEGRRDMYAFLSGNSLPCRSAGSKNVREATDERDDPN